LPVSRLILGDQGKDFPLERLEYLRLSEETGDADEEILVQGLDFTGITSEKSQVPLEILNLLERHATGDAARHRASLVVAEVGLGSRSDQAQQVGQQGVARG